MGPSYGKFPIRIPEGSIFIKIWEWYGKLTIRGSYYWESLEDQCVGFFLGVHLGGARYGTATRRGAAIRNSWQKTQTGHICELIHCLLAARKDVPGLWLGPDQW